MNKIFTLCTIVHCVNICLINITNKKETEKYIKEYIKEYMKNRYKRKGHIKIGSRASAILFTMVEGAKTMAEILAFFAEGLDSVLPRASWSPEMRGRKYLSMSQLTGGLTGLERGGYIQRKRVEGIQTVCLTEKGTQEILKYKMKSNGLEKSWDGKWRLVVFDIKEITRKDRDYLRRQLKLIGFQELQKSVWIFPYEIRDELQEFIKLCKFEFQGDVRFILADKIEPDLLFREKFNLV